MELVELKNTISKLNNSLNGFKNRLKTVKEKSNQLEDTETETVQIKT